MAKRTPRYPCLAVLGARLLGFGGWDLPLDDGLQFDHFSKALLRN